jgi:hypothetical protein
MKRNISCAGPIIITEDYKRVESVKGEINIGLS